MARTLAAVARAVGGRLDGPDATYANVTIDSRTVSTGDLFVAIEGSRADGHAFVGDAAAHGAAGAIVSRIVDAPLAQIETGDTVTALGALARAWRDGFEIPVVAVTGSNGKTTVKELVATILRERGSVCWSEASLNNHLGVPLTLLRLTAAHDVLVAELGANHPGEIDYLAGLVSPTVGVITNANACHLEGFGSIGGVATAKGELLDHLPRAGTAVLNADDDYFADWRARSHAETVHSFGLSAQADCTVRGPINSTPAGSSFSIVLPGGETCDVELPLKGRHNVVNALAAAAAATAVGATAADVVAGLASAHAVRGRINIREGLNGAVLIDDSYNANPASVRAALDYLQDYDGTRIAVLGDMGELGDDAHPLHAQIGSYARERCDALFCIGELSTSIAEGYGERARHFGSLDDLADALVPLMAPDTTVLVKASRFMGLDRLVEVLGAVAEPGNVREATC